MSAEFLLYVAYVLLALSAASAAYVVTAARGEQEVLGTSADRRPRSEGALLDLLLRASRALAPLFRNREDSPAGRQLDRTLRRAGRPFGLTAAEFQGLRVVSLFLGIGFGYFASIAVWNEPSWPLIFGLGALGAFYPVTRLRAVVQNRSIQVFRDMPYVLEILTLSTEAGQDFSSALGTVVEKSTPGPLVDELRIVNQEVTLGKSRGEALRDMATRLDLPEVTSFVLALIQAEQLGTGIGKVLRIMAEQMRVKRATIAEELAGKVPVKLMAPLMTCILPASFIILLFGPIYAYMTGQELGG